MRNLLSLLLPLVFFNCYQTERHCADFKTGTFEFTYTIDNEEKTGTFVRTEDYNIDFYENKVDSSSVRWINDCEFVLKKLNPKHKNEEKAIHMKIISTTEDAYVFEYQLAVKDAFQQRRVEKGVAKKIK
ncbi:hypothetical protein [Psychroserpens sp. SPM9]|uniref:hypothetical protein n=1 Tax=Psychroserpens sp. SPM9 TaxID=2975598 RepID=UPI0021A88D2E|nr:hypothetical protein [Psychroserpens sp. SPM9]MDG5491945.1 hypothetical protein [Psychroserpens sp. SPM9]